MALIQWPNYGSLVWHEWQQLIRDNQSKSDMLAMKEQLEQFKGVHPSGSWLGYKTPHRQDADGLELELPTHGQVDS
jgi:hypothetical protein